MYEVICVCLVCGHTCLVWAVSSLCPITLHYTMPACSLPVHPCLANKIWPTNSYNRWNCLQTGVSFVQRSQFSVCVLLNCSAGEGWSTHTSSQTEDAQGQQTSNCCVINQWDGGDSAATWFSLSFDSAKMKWSNIQGATMVEKDKGTAVITLGSWMGK